MQGPTTTARRSRRAPSFSIAAIVASTTPPSAPFQPACAAPITRACGSASSTGAQSAAITPSTTPGRSVTSPSALGAPGEVQRSLPTVSTSVEWIWYRVRRSGSSRPKRLGDAAAVLAHVVGTVARAVAAVQRRIEAAADAAAPGEEAMLDAVEVGERGSFDHAAFRKTGRRALLSSPTAMTRNKVPIWSGPIKRAKAASIGVALRPALARAFERFRTLQDSQPPQEVALPHRPEVGASCRRRERGEVDMRAEVGLARPVEDVGAAVAAHRLQRGARARTS